MSLEGFQKKDNETIDISIIKRVFLKSYHQQAANLNNSDQNIEFIFWENNDFHQIGNASLQYELTVEKGIANGADRILVVGDAIRLVNNAFANCFKAVRLSNTKVSDIEHNKYCGQISIVLRALTSKDGDLLTRFDQIDASQTEIYDSSPKHILVNNHDVAANKSKTKGILPLEHFFGFCKTFKKLLNK